MAISSFRLLELRAALESVGVTAGDTLVLHSSLMDLGRPVGTPLREYPSRVVDVILDLIGVEGTLAVPASNWDYGRQGVPFDLQRSSSAKDLGVLPRHILTRPGVVRSSNPTFSLAILGARGAWLCDGGNAHGFGYDSAWDRLYQLDATMLFLGCDLAALSFTRYMEMRFGVPYLYNKYFTTPVWDRGVQTTHPIVSLLRYQHIPIKYDMQRFEQVLRECGALAERGLGGSHVLAVNMRRCFEEGMACLKRDIHFFLASPPAYQSDQLPRI